MNNLTKYILVGFISLAVGLIMGAVSSLQINKLLFDDDED